MHNLDRLGSMVDWESYLLVCCMGQKHGYQETGRFSKRLKKREG